MPEVFGFDCYSPQQIAERVEAVGVAKANLPLPQMVALGVLAGGFVGLGAMACTIVASDPTLPFAVARWLGGAVFALGLVLVVVAGAELFTGNNLLVMAWVSRRVPTRLVLRNLAVVYVANFVGAAGLAWLVARSGHAAMNDGAIGRAAIAIATGKCALAFAAAFWKGVLCNLLVCLAVWLAMAGRTVTDKILAVVLPVATFVAAGFEHSIANMYFVPLALFLDVPGAGGALGWNGFLHNLVPVTLGNLVGGAGLVGLVYWVVYRRPVRG
ncbi:MAG: formate/nitrite transporter family protein [Planctomycetes bacterium]|nr:formate/nitrite transporter family protein [Planctomycetota bacterium]